MDIRLMTYGVAGLVLFASGYWVSSQIAENHLERELKKQEIILVERCNKDKAITEELNEYLQSQNTDINTKLDKYRVYAGKCVAISSDTANLPSSGSKPIGSGGLTIGFIRGIAAQGDIYRAQRMTCDKYFEAIRNR